MSKSVNLSDKTEVGVVVIQSAADKKEAFRLMKLAASKRMLERKKAATDKLVALALRIGTDEEKAAAKYLSGELRVKNVSTDKVYEAFEKEGTLHEDTIFKSYKLGRAEMRRFMKKHADVSFDAARSVYVLSK